jgi:uncharacterized membrane protein YcfT
MPDFFLVAGLFAGRAVDRSWRELIDRKVLHFAYFYALWLLITLAIKSAELGLHTPTAFFTAYLAAFVEPFGSMWFIQLLPILFLATRLTRDWPVPIVVGIAAAMHVLAAMFPEGGAYAMASRMTGSTTIDSFFLFFIYFVCGALFSDRIFAFAAEMRQQPGLALIGLLGWALIEEFAVKVGSPEIPGATVLFGMSGAFAVIALSVLLSRTGSLKALAYCGRNSLVIYLAFFAPMAATRILLLKLGLIPDVGWMSLIVSAVAIISPLALSRMVRGTRLGFLFTRPAWARLEPRRSEPRIPALVDVP